jgi:hypothetical protein
MQYGIKTFLRNFFQYFFETKVHMVHIITLAELTHIALFFVYFYFLFKSEFSRSTAYLAKIIKQHVWQHGQDIWTLPHTTDSIFYFFD